MKFFFRFPFFYEVFVLTIQIVKLIMSSINPLACHLKIPEKYGADRRIGGEDYEKKDY